MGEAGLRAGDVVVAIDGQPLIPPEGIAPISLFERLAGERIVLTLSDGRVVEVVAR